MLRWITTFVCPIVFCVAGAHAQSDPEAYWPFDETSGTVALDASGNGHDGTLVSGVERGDGISGGGVRFSGSGDAVEVAAAAGLGQLQQVTIAAWVRQAARGEFTAIVDVRADPTTGYDLFFSDTGRLFMRVNAWALTGSTVVADDTWHHLVGVWDGLELRLYVDGVLDVSSPVPVTTVDVDVPVLLGRHFENVPRWEASGSLDEVRIYARALDASEVLSLFEGDSADTAAPLRSNGRPTGVLPSGTVEVTLEVDTNEAAECRWSDVEGTEYSAMPDVFATTGGTNHATPIFGLADGETYAFSIRCADALGNANADDLVVEFVIDTATPGDPGLIAHWPFEENGTMMTDVSGNGHDAVLVGGATTNPGVEGAALDLRATQSYAEAFTSTSLDQPQALSIAAWIRHDPHSEFAAIVDKRDGVADGYDLYLDNAGRAFLRVDSETLVGVQTVTDGTWHHLVGVWDGFGLEIYVDGVLDASRLVPATTVSTTGPLRLGHHFQGTTQYDFAGLMDEVRIYDRALSLTEILDLSHNLGGDEQPPIRSNAQPSGTLPPGTENAILALDTDEPAQCRWSQTPGTPFESMIETFVTTGGTSHATEVMGLMDGGSYSYAVRCLDGAGNANSDDLLISFTVDLSGSGGGDLLAHWPFDEGTGNVTVDVSGNGRDAVLVNGPMWISGVDGLALDFAGLNDGVEAPAAVVQGPQTALTVAAWIRHGTPSDFSSIVDQRDTVSDGYDLFLSDQGRAFARVNTSTLVGTTLVADDTWHHLAAVWDGSSLALYVDGVLDASAPASTTTVDVTAPIRVGRHFQLQSGFESAGAIDDVRIYGRALDGGEVQALAATSAPRLSLASGFPDKHVVQRMGTTADLSLGGGYVGDPSAIEGRVVHSESGAPLAGFDWTVLDAAPANGMWSGILSAVPQGGWYRLELRFANDPGVSLSPSNRFGVGMIVAALGQSSMAKLFTEISFAGDGDLGVASQDVPDVLTHRYGYGDPRVSATDRGGYLRPATNPGTPHYGDVTGAGGVRFANQLAQALNIPVLILDFAIDGTSISEWTDPQWIGRQNFDTALAVAGGDLEALVWFQGGADILANTPQSAYLAGLDTFYSQIQAQLPVGRTLELFEAVQGRGDYPQPNDTSWDAIRQVQREWTSDRDHVHPAATAIDLHLAARTFDRGDGHFTASQYQILADRYTRAILDHLGAPGWTGGVAGPQIVAATQSGTRVTVLFAHDQGTGLTVPDPATDVEGFELSADGFQTVLRLGQGIVSTELSVDGQTIEIELDQTYPAGLELHYLRGMNPFGHKPTEAQRRANGNTVLDDFAYHPSRIGLPVHGTTYPVSIVLEP